ncbi:hypothetical protein T439DRAFT_350138 [Meredithblackwellia eburnea MCA 4105]
MLVINPSISTILPHSLGNSYLAFSPDGKFMYTTGDEGYVRIFDSSSTGTLNDPKTVTHFEDPVTSVSTSKDFWVASCENGDVDMFSAGQEELARRITRCSLPVRSARFDSKGKWIAITSDELIVKLIDAANPDNFFNVTGHRKGLRDATWSPDGSLLTSTDSDGEIRVWQTGKGEPTCIHTFENIVSSGSVEDALPMGAAWHPSGHFFVIVNKDNEILIINREGWTRGATFSGNAVSHTSPITALAWSPNGLYLVTVGKDDHIIVWKTATRQPVVWVKTPKHQVTNISFHPSSGANALAWVDNNGHLSRWSEVLPENEADPSFIRREREASERARSESVAPTRKFKSSKPANMFDEEADADDLGDDDDGMRSMDDDKIGHEGEEDEFGHLDQGWIDDDLGMGDYDDLDQPPPMPRKIGQSVNDWKREVASGGGSGGKYNSGAGGSSSSYLTSSKGQDPFQPGATPLKDRKRYLAFNMTGIIHAIEREDENIYTVEFHDQSAHLGFHFKDPYVYDFAAIGELGAVFASKSTSLAPARIYYRPYDSWSRAEPWEIKLANGESPVAIAVGGIPDPLDEDEMSIAGSGSVVVATNAGYLRFFSGSGIQKRVEHFDDGDDVVAMSASRDWLLVVSRNGPAIGAKQNLNFSIIDLDTFETVQQGRVPMPVKEKATLKWIGFTDEQIPALYNSAGVLSLLDKSRHPGQGKWLVALEMHHLARREDKQESYWPIGVTDKNVNVIILKGLEQYPGFPTPIFQEIPLQFPLLRQDVQQGQLEEVYAREMMFIANRRDGVDAEDFTLKATIARQELDTDKHLLKLIQTACKAENLRAALDATLMLSQPNSLEAAKKIAAFFSLPALEERIERVTEEKSGLRQAQDQHKRELKWAHRVDDRVIPYASDARNNSSANWFNSAPPSSFASTVAPRMSSVAPSRERTRVMREETTFGNEELESDETMVGDGYTSPEEMVRSPKRMRSEEGDEDVDMADEQESMPPPIAPAPVAAPKKASNPFAKKPAAPKPPPSTTNPFASKKGGKANDVKRSHSFLHRVEGTAPPKAKGKKAAAIPASKPPARSGEKQTTLFGLPPGQPALKEKGKKRKAGSGDEEETPAPTAKKVSSKPPPASAVQSLAPRKELPRDGEEFEESQETQPVEESQQVESQLELVQEQEETQEEESQLEETQMEETQVEDTPSQIEKENTNPTAGGGDGLSKLAQFRATAIAA